MAKYKSNIVTVNTTWTNAQLQAALDNLLNQGWELKEIILLNAGNIKAIFIKQVTA
jgi:hypothetical protein